MKTTLVIDDVVMRRLKEEAARSGKTLSELVESALRAMLDRAESPANQDVPPLPVFSVGPPRVDVSDREALYQAMEGR